VKGDVLVIEEYHRRAAGLIAAALEDDIRAKAGRFVITVAGESGSGKSETAAALVERLRQDGFGSVILGMDDYVALPPRSNDARRRADPEWLGPHVEVRLDLLQANIDAALAGASAIEKPIIDYEADSLLTEVLSLDGVKAVVVEGTYVSLLRHVDRRVFIARNRLETLAHRRKRNRGKETRDPFVERLLGTEHKIIAGHRLLADLVVTRDFDVVRTD
jgi:uridine kinase